MIRDFEFYHGLVFARILHATQRPLSIRPFQSASNSSYVVNDTVGIFIKYSSKRMTPWRFTFMTEHQQEIDLLKAQFEKVFLVLVCSDDGVVCLSYDELKQILDNLHDPIEWISAARHKREMYSVKGSNGELDFKIGQSEFPSKLFAG
ncbi:MAG TPA: hypothetical protein VFV96_01710 [Verrucomicrobiae bacterium]|nr:hypothetical protein [Verrucomicrobiae bacterium]